ncbi:NmrA family NAD(P)-binding protein [Coprobacter tertius]|uniref:NAD(P)H-binding protein n=1 Tax=Coprobacter tertius TaxID=2944915 RepID=A0ABT1MIF7_9BACT|nr:NAD(P)H-binding protein [Coprobacter tertius]MCP9612164.1 NAD(P)H-binding protein [Coprobacter tertius]
MILITDITDCLGREILALLDKNDFKIPVKAIVNEKEAKNSFSVNLNTEFYEGSINDHPFLDKVLKNVDTILVTDSNILFDKRMGYINLVNAARGNKVKRIIFISTVGPDHSECCIIRENRDTEKYIRQSGITYNIVRVNILMERLPFFIGDPIENKVIYYPAGSGRISFVSVKDIAEFLIRILMSPQEENKEYSLSHNVSYSFGDIAEKLSQNYGKPIIYEHIDINLYRDALLQTSLSEQVIDRFCSVAKSIQNNEFDVTDGMLQSLLNPHNGKTIKQNVMDWFKRKDDSTLSLNYKLMTLPEFLSVNNWKAVDA